MVSLLVLLHIPLGFTQQLADPPPGCGVSLKNVTILPKWKKLFSAGKTLIVFYKTPSAGYGPGHELVSTAMIYLEQIEKLEKAVDENKPGAMDAVWELYLCGGPLHLKQIPYDKFIKTFNWDSNDIDEYFSLINQTRKIWSRLVEELARVADPDLVI